MHEYLALIQDILQFGEQRGDRTGTGTLSLFGENLEFDLREGFPLLTNKKIHWKSVVYELLWFLRGETNTKYLTDRGVNIWNEWADNQGELGPVYGRQWNDFQQLDKAIHLIKKEPESRRIIINAWNVEDLAEMALPPCHMMHQYYVHGGDREYLSMQMYQRSADMFLGVPFNIASYALLLSIMARITGKHPAKLKMTLGDAHVYLNHREQANEMIRRRERTLPQLKIRDDLTVLQHFREASHEDFVLLGYNPWPAIKADVAV